jgi:hypothetical protein
VVMMGRDADVRFSAGVLAVSELGKRCRGAIDVMISIGNGRRDGATG